MQLPKQTVEEWTRQCRERRIFSLGIQSSRDDARGCYTEDLVTRMPPPSSRCSRMLGETVFHRFPLFSLFPFWPSLAGTVAKAGVYAEYKWSRQIRSLLKGFSLLSATERVPAIGPTLGLPVSILTVIRIRCMLPTGATSSNLERIMTPDVRWRPVGTNVTIWTALTLQQNVCRRSSLRANMEPRELNETIPGKSLLWVMTRCSVVIIGWNVCDSNGNNLYKYDIIENVYVFVCRKFANRILQPV